MSNMEKKEKNINYSELPEGEEIKISKRESQRGKENKDVGKKRIYKRNSYLKERNNPERFSGEGINFRAKIIGIEDVLDARGNRMCQGALQKLKENVKLMGAHKQRIILNVSLNGIIIKDEKTGEILHHHPIHKISCISQDTKDNRAFGFVYGCPQTGHRFFAIKTEKAASQVVVTLRDLFLVALEIKKKEIEKASDTLKEEEQGESTEDNYVDNSSSNGHAAVNNCFSSTSLYENTKMVDHDLLYSNTVLLPEEALPKSEPAELEPPLESLLDLQSEFDNLQQGISQMDRSIASRSLGFSVSEEEVSESTSVPTSFQFKLDKLSSLYQETMSISSRSSSTSDYIYATENKQEENDTPKKEPSANLSSAASEGCSSSFSVGGNSSVSETSHSSSTVEDRYAVFQDIDSLPSIFDNPGIVKVPEEKGIDASNLQQNGSNEFDDEEPEAKSSTPVPFSELDPLGNQPYVDKKDFFQDIKNPPKKVLKDLVGANRGFDDGLENDAFSNSNQCFRSTDFNNSDSESFSKEDDFQNPSPMLPLKKTVVEPAFSSELFPESDFSDKVSWECKNPFNPFLNEDYPDIPPPNSPPPPPPPRLPSLSSFVSSSSPPPRPPSRVSCAPTPPLPKRKVPLLGSTQQTWFSFDQDTLPAPVASSSSSEQQQGPPLPSPARKLPPPIAKYESPSSSASNSPAAIKRLLHNRNWSQDSYSTPLSENGDSLENNLKNSTKVDAEARSSVSEDAYSVEDTSYSAVAFNPFSVRTSEFSACLKNEKQSPPPPVLPPKPGSFSRSSPVKKANFIPSASLYSSSVAESSSSDTQSTLNDAASGRSLEVSSCVDTSTNGQQLDVAVGQETVHLQSSTSGVSDQSPDSIFRRKSDPFADDFFMTLHKRSDGTSKISTAIDRHSDTMKAPT